LNFKFSNNYDEIRKEIGLTMSRSAFERENRAKVIAIKVEHSKKLQTNVRTREATTKKIKTTDRVDANRKGRNDRMRIESMVSLVRNSFAEIR
jgi:hypothetical protein